MTAEKSEIRNATYSSLEHIRKTWPDLAEGSDADRFIDSEKAVGRLCHYKIFSDQGHQIIAEVRSKYGHEATKVFLRVVLLRGVKNLVESNDLDALPLIVRNYQLDHLRRISFETDTSSEWLTISHDIFHKEFGLVSLRLLAAGAQLIDVRCGIPRSMLLKNGLSGIPRLAYTFAKLGGFKPYFQIHTHKFNLDQFNERGWEECYRGCAALYQIFPDSLGMFGGSWFYDPALDEISPRLSYLRKTPLAGGAIINYCATDEESKGNALSSSASRRALFEQGKYTPKSYMLIWGKTNQILWAKNNTV